MPTWILRLGEYDERILHAVVVRRRRHVDILIRALTHLGDASTSIALAGFLALGVVPALEGAGKTAAFALAFSHILVQILKRSFSRPRPNLPVGITSLMKAPDRFSFPSGHSAAALSVFLPMALATPVPGSFLILALGIAVGFSRCYLGVHYPGDVLAGWTLAALAVFIADPTLNPLI